MNRPKGYADLADLPEDERIATIAATALAGSVVGVVVDDVREKADRYVRKLEAKGVHIIDRRPGPVARTVLLRVGPKEN